MVDYISDNWEWKFIFQRSVIMTHQGFHLCLKGFLSYSKLLGYSVFVTWLPSRKSYTYDTKDPRVPEVGGAGGAAAPPALWLGGRGGAEGAPPLWKNDVINIHLSLNLRKMKKENAKFVILKQQNLGKSHFCKQKRVPACALLRVYALWCVVSNVGFSSIKIDKLSKDIPLRWHYRNDISHSCGIPIVQILLQSKSALVSPYCAGWGANLSCTWNRPDVLCQIHFIYTSYDLRPLSINSAPFVTLCILSG